MIFIRFWSLLSWKINYFVLLAHTWLSTWLILVQALCSYLTMHLAHTYTSTLLILVKQRAGKLFRLNAGIDNMYTLGAPPPLPSTHTHTLIQYCLPPIFPFKLIMCLSFRDRIRLSQFLKYSNPMLDVLDESFQNAYPAVHLYVIATFTQTFITVDLDRERKEGNVI